MSGLFITGTDTGVGKTVVAAACMHRFRPIVRLRYWKPVQTGIELDDDTAAVQNLGRCGDSEILSAGIRLRQPLSPHLAALLTSGHIELESLLQIFRAEPDTSSWLVEGAGGALVPLNETQTTADLMAALGLAVLVVARSELGTINHTLLTLEALRSRSIPIAGIVMTGTPNPDNRRSIEHFGAAPVVAEIPRLSPLTPEVLGGWSRTGMDPCGVLMEFLR